MLTAPSNPYPSENQDRNKYTQHNPGAGNSIVLDSPNLTQDSVQQALITPSFKDKSFIVLLNQLTHISHSRGAKEILNA